MRFFTFMGIFLKDKKEDPTKPLEETPEVEPVEEPVVSDANACGSCNGTGLVWHEGAKVDERCPVCQGKGKVD